MYEDLIKRLREESLYKDKATLEIMDICMEAAEALENLDTQLDVLVKEDIEAQQELAGYRSSFMESGCRLQSELREALGISITSPCSCLLYPPL